MPIGIPPETAKNLLLGVCFVAISSFPQFSMACTLSHSRMMFCSSFVRSVFAVMLLSTANVSFALEGPLTPEQSIAAFRLEPGLRVELVAAEPLVIDPVAVAFDEQGRMFVAEDAGYPTGPGPGKPPLGRIVLLEDRDADGKYEKRTIFADGLTFPNGIMPWKGGVYVTCAPDIFYFKDNDGDGKAEVRKVVFSGFQAQSTTQLRISHPTLNVDNWVYINSGLTASKVISPDCKKEPLQINRLDFRFKPDSCDYEEVSGTAQFGGTFDKFGRRFICSNRNHNQHVVMQGRYLRRNPNLTTTDFVQDTPEHGAACRVYAVSHNITTAASHAGYFTSACGVTIYSGTALPREYEGNSFTCEPAGNLVHRDILEAKGATFSARRAFATNEFIASPDNWFRPVNLATGPDGALYLCDMYRKTIEHPEYLPEGTRKITDFESGKDKGRIYRIVAATHKSELVKLKFATAGTRELCDSLKDPNSWTRMTAHRLLLERRPADAPKWLKKLAQSARAPETRIQALHLLSAMNALEDGQIERALRDNAAPVREHAIQLAEPRLAGSPELFDSLVKLAVDPDPRVRFQCALALGEVNDKKIVAPLVRIAVRDANDKWARAAVMSSIANFPEPFLKEIMPEASKVAARDIKQMDSLLPLLSELGRSLPSEPGKRLGVLNEITRSQKETDALGQIALLNGYSHALAARQTDSTESDSPLMTAVMDDSSITPSHVRALIAKAAASAADVGQSTERRLLCIGLLAQAPVDGIQKVLLGLLNPQQPSEIQIAAIRALARVADADAGTALVKREQWYGYTQSVKDALLGVMVAQPKLLEVLLSAIERGDVPVNSINPEKRNQMMRHKVESIKNRATALFSAIKPSDRMKVYEEYKAVLSMKANARNGHEIFTRTCTSCHTFSGEGHLVGPDLTGIRSQPSEVVLLHIIVPEFEMMPIYSQYNVETKDGQSFSGILTSETASSITLKQALGIEQKIERSNIASMASSSLSLMPQELEQTMTRQELADLIAFLKGE